MAYIMAPSPSPTMVSDSNKSSSNKLTFSNSTCMQQPISPGPSPSQGDIYQYSYPPFSRHVETTSMMSSSRSHGSSRSSRHSHSRSSRHRPSHCTLQQLISSLETHSVNTLTELCRIERIAATLESEEDAVVFQGPMTSAWDYYVNSYQLLTELRGMTRSYPFSGDVIYDAHLQVRADPDSNRSWNLAWLVLTKIRDTDLIPAYAALEASRPEMWGGRDPSPEEASQLAACFEYEWNKGVATMLRHWSVPPTWY